MVAGGVVSVDGDAAAAADADADVTVAAGVATADVTVAAAVATWGRGLVTGAVAGDSVADGVTLGTGDGVAAGVSVPVDAWAAVAAGSVESARATCVAPGRNNMANVIANATRAVSGRRARIFVAGDTNSTKRRPPPPA